MINDWRIFVGLLFFWPCECAENSWRVLITKKWRSQETLSGQHHWLPHFNFASLLFSEKNKISNKYFYSIHMFMLFKAGWDDKRKLCLNFSNYLFIGTLKVESKTPILRVMHHWMFSCDSLSMRQAAAMHGPQSGKRRGGEPETSLDCRPPIHKWSKKKSSETIFIVIKISIGSHTTFGARHLLHLLLFQTLRWWNALNTCKLTLISKVLTH